VGNTGIITADLYQVFKDAQSLEHPAKLTEYYARPPLARSNEQRIEF
jgi:hypothetical protein